MFPFRTPYKKHILNTMFFEGCPQPAFLSMESYLPPIPQVWPALSRWPCLGSSIIWIPKSYTPPTYQQVCPWKKLFCWKTILSRNEAQKSPEATLNQTRTGFFIPSFWVPTGAVTGVCWRLTNLTYPQVDWAGKHLSHEFLTLGDFPLFCLFLRGIPILGLSKTL